MRYIAIIIVSFLLAISIVSATKECFQESAINITITDTPNCGLKYDGDYGGDENVERNLWVDGGVNGGLGNDINVTGWHDGDYLTFSVIVKNLPVYVNYSIPNNTVGAKWSVTVAAGVIIELNSSTGNFSIPSSCLNNIFSNILQIKITNDEGWNLGRGIFHTSCWNYASSSWYEFWTQGTPNVWLFEESVWWNVSSYESEPIVLNNNHQNINGTSLGVLSNNTKSLLDLTIGILSLALVITTLLWAYRLFSYNEITLKKVIIIFAYLTIGLTLLRLIASLINNL